MQNDESHLDGKFLRKSVRIVSFLCNGSAEVPILPKDVCIEDVSTKYRTENAQCSHKTGGCEILYYLQKLHLAK